MREKGRIVVLGSINNDLVITAQMMPTIGETVRGKNFMNVAGGKGANQAVAAARLGGRVSLIGAVGMDVFGRTMVDNFRKDGIYTEYIKFTGSYPTGTAVIILHKGDNFIVVDMGANQDITTEDLNLAENEIKRASILMTQLEIPIEASVFGMKLAKKHGVKIMFDPAPAVKLDDEILTLCDIITPNKTECEIITGIPIETSRDVKKAVRFLMDKGISQVVVTLGENGCVFNDKNEIFSCPVTEAENVVDTTAAGDSFSGALAVALTEGKSIKEAVLFASRVSAITVSKMGAQISLPYRAGVDA